MVRPACVKSACVKSLPKNVGASRILKGMKKRLAFPALLLALFLSACDQGTGPDDGQGGSQPGAPAVTRLEVAPAALTVGGTATYTWSVDNAAASCALDVDADGTPEYTANCATGAQAHTFAESGTFAAVLSATAAGLSTPATAPTVTVTDEGTPPGTLPGGLSWEQAALPPFGVAEGQGVSLGGKLYVFGGFDSTFRCCRPTDRTFVFDPAAGSWTPLEPLPPMNGTPYGGVTHAGFTTDGQDVFFAGGYTSNARNTAQLFSTREVWRYNVAANSYTRLPDLPEPRGAGQLEYAGGKLYFYGGSDASRRVDTGELFILDLANGAAAWTEGAPFPNPRNHLGSVALGGKIYAVGGQHEHDGRLVTQDDVHAYDPRTDTWQAVSSLPQAISHHSNSTFVVDGRIVVVGGQIDHLEGVTNVVAYSPEADAWTELTPLPLAMVDPVAENVGGRIVVAYNWRPKAFIGTFR